LNKGLNLTCLFLLIETKALYFTLQLLKMIYHESKFSSSILNSILKLIMEQECTQVHLLLMINLEDGLMLQIMRAIFHCCMLLYMGTYQWYSFCNNVDLICSLRLLRMKIFCLCVSNTTELNPWFISCSQSTLMILIRWLTQKVILFCIKPVVKDTLRLHLIYWL
jgi:hypothetical protein